MTRVEDLESRLVGQETEYRTYLLDWACKHCKRCGGLPVRVSGRSRDARGRPQTHESREETLRRLIFMHRYGLPDGTTSTEPRCKHDDQIDVGLAWRWIEKDGQRVKDWLPKKCFGCDGEGRLPQRDGGKTIAWSMCLSCKGTGGWLPETYSWPPWVAT